MHEKTARKEIEKIPRIERLLNILREQVTTGVPITADVDYNGNAIINIGGIGFQNGQEITWNTKYHTINIPTGDGSVNKVGIDIMFDIHNATGGTLFKGEVVYPTGTSTGGVSNVDKAIANSHETTESLLGFVAADIPDGQDGHVLVSGILDPVNTNSLLEGPVYLSATIPGALTSTKPEFPDYAILLGVVDFVAVNGVLTVDSSFNINNTVVNAWDGSFRENLDFLVTSDGATITGSLERSGGGNLTMLLAEGFVTLDCTPPQTLTLVPGTDTNPQHNFVFIDAATKVLQTSTSGFPETEHVKVADVILQSASKVQIEGALGNRNWNDHIKKIGDNGHILHIAERLRENPASWKSGTQGSSVVDSPTNSNVYVAATGGTIFQLHKQNFPAIDTQLGDNVHIINHPVTPYIDVTNLNGQVTDSLGGALSNKSFSFVLWGVINKTGEPSHLMLNLPVGSYPRTSPDQAVADASNYSVYNIPDIFKGKGFLIARFTYQLASNATDWTLYETEDLRGKIPNTTAGGGGGGTGVTDFTSLLDTPNAYTGEAGKAAVVGAGETGIEFKTIFQQVTGLTLLSASWVADSGLFKYDLAQADILATSSVDIIPDNADIDTVKTAEFLPETTASAGIVTIWATNQPAADVDVTINIFN